MHLSFFVVVCAAALVVFLAAASGRASALSLQHMVRAAARARANGESAFTTFGAEAEIDNPYIVTLKHGGGEPGHYTFVAPGNGDHDGINVETRAAESAAKVGPYDNLPLFTLSLDNCQCMLLDDGLGSIEAALAYGMHQSPHNARGEVVEPDPNRNLRANEGNIGLMVRDRFKMCTPELITGPMDATFAHQALVDKAIQLYLEAYLAALPDAIKFEDMNFDMDEGVINRWLRNYLDSPHRPQRILMDEDKFVKVSNVVARFNAKIEEVKDAHPGLVEFKLADVAAKKNGEDFWFFHQREDIKDVLKPTFPKSVQINFAVPLARVGVVEGENKLVQHFPAQGRPLGLFKKALATGRAFVNSLDEPAKSDAETHGVFVLLSMFGIGKGTMEGKDICPFLFKTGVRDAIRGIKSADVRAQLRVWWEARSGDDAALDALCPGPDDELRFSADNSRDCKARIKGHKSDIFNADGALFGDTDATYGLGYHGDAPQKQGKVSLSNHPLPVTFINHADDKRAAVVIEAREGTMTDGFKFGKRPVPEAPGMHWFRSMEEVSAKSKDTITIIQDIAGMEEPEEADAEEDAQPVVHHNASGGKGGGGKGGKPISPVVQ